MNKSNTIRLFGLDLTNATQSDAVQALLEGTARRTAAFVNAHVVNVAAGDPAYRWALGRADHLLPDGSGISLAAKLKRERFEANLNGTDLFLPLCREAAARGLSIYFLGSRPGIADAAAANAARIVDGLKVAGTRDGYFAADESDAVIAQVNASGADIVLVAFGVPLQDLWVARNRHRLDARLVMGVGAQFDFWSGSVSRAPKWMRRTGIEWIHRLLLDPKRLAKRYLIGNATFVARAVAARVAGDADKVGAVGGKRLLDLALAGGGLLAMAPVLAGVAAAIKLETKGPVLFRQTRIGQNGVPFTVLKFRSMHVDAEARRAELLAQSDRAGVCFKLKRDPRVTRVGRFLRRLSLDELPQLINVVRGEMALVGPRPGLPEEVAAYPPEALARLGVKPGLTGLWQVAGRAEVSFTKMIALDSAYAASRSLMLDLMLVALTARAVITGRGAV
ncbi:WecB/TagA/CpsF family glycosyltransferase [Acuticoccus sp. MNP-M23]|uniref:WecB/TagA/CpsF family glycosyltransferase n=1 Tax=Acuticoccus sp. MNP-M23 TaxID=3072793 RepID=UPI002815A2B9|nr:WecB/TagA/CpsF family glycosyltransferase [Acuticoccus sp. MNP-M23]WMS42799.1 WecB/TagA/CpsF family glycosyltransferase [Acuticoccus sp. MNP-M23]